VRSDQGDDIANRITRFDTREIVINHRCDCCRSARIPASCNRCRPDLAIHDLLSWCCTSLICRAARRTGTRNPEPTRDDIAAIAALANLEIASTELELFARQLGEILAYAEQVQQVDTTGIPATSAVVTRHTVDREDRVLPSLALADALANAPEPAPESGLFKVPRVI
jgi:aspartyl-tRNA(Asn)/glutamyl-tRNA(Gln) amidotransferase subunit C